MIIILFISQITHILEACPGGGPQAAEALLPLVYDELRKLAAYKMAHEAPGQTLQPTALVHEAWLRLTGSPNGQFMGRAHFFAAAAEAMRRILIDRARRKAAQRHGGRLERLDFDEIELASPSSDDRLLAINEALDKLATEHPLAAELVKLRYFVGMTTQQAAEVLGISRRTAMYHWAHARAWLYCEVTAAEAKLVPAISAP